MSKYGNKVTVIDGYKFMSRLEANHYLYLKGEQQAGRIRNLKVHPKFVLQEGFRRNGKAVPAITYEADFSFEESPNWELIAWDSKGVETAVFRIKQKLFWCRYPDIELRVVA